VQGLPPGRGRGLRWRRGERGGRARGEVPPLLRRRGGGALKTSPASVAIPLSAAWRALEARG